MLSGVTALVIEEEYLIALEAQRVLETAGATVIIARNLAEGELVRLSNAIGVALLSIGPDRDGPAIAFCETLRAAGVAVVVVSSDSIHRHGIPGLEGIDVVLKPFSDDELLAATISALLKRGDAPNA